MSAATVRDWYDTHPSNTRKPRPGTPTLAKVRENAILQQIGERLRVARDFVAFPGAEPPKRVYFTNRKADRKTAAGLGRRKCDHVVAEPVTPAVNAIETAFHKYSPGALRRERNLLKRARRQAREAARCH